MNANTPQQGEPRQDTATFLQSIANGWGEDFPDDIDDADLGADSSRDPL